MIDIYCPHCKGFLFKTDIANAEVKCHKCKRWVSIIICTATGIEKLALTSELNRTMILEEAH
jgi:phage FluMu protein Com